MATRASFLKELKGFGDELAKTVKDARSSKEFKDLEHQLASGIKAISASIEKSYSAAKKSPHATNLKRKLGRVVKVGKTQGAAEAKKARAMAMQKFAKAQKTLKALSAKLAKKKTSR